MAKTAKEFYEIRTYLCEINTSELTNTVFIESKEDAIKMMDMLFKKCYPKGFNPSSMLVLAANIESPRYNDGDVYLSRFYTLGGCCYEMSTNEFEIL